MILHPDPPRARARACGRAAALLFVSFGLALGGCTTLSSAPPASQECLLAEARIALEQAERSVSWNLGAVQEGQQKLAEAERQLKAGRLPAAGSAGSTGSDAVPSDTLHTPRVRGPRDPLIRRLAPTGHR